jgi:hypothetical protein
MPFLLTVATLVHAAGPVTTNRIYAINGTAVFLPPNPCIPGNPVDPVPLSGQIHVLTRVTPVDPTTETVWVHANLVNVSGVGASGRTYRAVGSDKNFFTIHPTDPISPVFVPFHGTYDFVQEGSCPNSNVNVNGVVQINPDGTQGPGSAFTFGEPTF